jgi:hypothetical protein
MPFKKEEIILKEIDANFWRLVEPVIYEGKTQTFIVPTGFKTDLASVPRLFTWLIPRYGIYTKSAVLHDFLCRTKAVNRSDADGLFRRTMRESDVPFLHRWMMWAAVRLNSRLEAASLTEVIAWLLISIPSIVFLLIPSIVLAVWLILGSILEWIFYALLRPFSSKRVNKPTLHVLLDR